MRLRQQSQLGVALITAILVMSLATITAVAMTVRKQVDFRRSENMLLHDQAYLYLLGAEDWAKQILLRDRNNNDYDSLKDDWATILPPMPVDGGSIGGHIEDLQGRFNLNNLANGDPESPDAQRFRKMLANINAPTELVNTIMDWIDADQELRFPGGAEDVQYLSGDHPYRTSNRLLESPTEILYVKGMTYEIYEQLEPAITALPESNLEINVNTAPATVLQSIIEDFTTADAEKFIEERTKEPFKKIEDFLQHPMIKGRKVVTTGIAVSSRYFLLKAQAKIGRTQSELQSILYRPDAKTIRAIVRSEGGI